MVRELVGVEFPERVQVCTVPFATDIAGVVPPSAYTVSVYPVNVLFVTVWVLVAVVVLASYPWTVTPISEVSK